VTALRDALRELAEARRAAEIISNYIALIQADIEKTPHWLAMAGFKRDLAEARAEAATATDAIKAAALAEHALSGNVKPAEGVQVKLFAKVVYEPQDVWSWCIVNAHKYLQLDVKAFEKAAPVLRDLGAPVELTKEARAQIATDLGVWLVSNLRPYAQQKDPVMERLLASEENNLLREEQYLAEKNAR